MMLFLFFFFLLSSKCQIPLYYTGGSLKDVTCLDRYTIWGLNHDGGLWKRYCPNDGVASYTCIGGDWTHECTISEMRRIIVLGEIGVNERFMGLTDALKVYDIDVGTCDISYTDGISTYSLSSVDGSLFPNSFTGVNFNGASYRHFEDSSIVSHNNEAEIDLDVKIDCCVATPYYQRFFFIKENGAFFTKYSTNSIVESIETNFNLSTVTQMRIIQRPFSPTSYDRPDNKTDLYVYILKDNLEIYFLFMTLFNESYYEYNPEWIHLPLSFSDENNENVVSRIERYDLSQKDGTIGLLMDSGYADEYPYVGYLFDHTCNDIPALNHSTVCGGRGICVSQDNCYCFESNLTGTQCIHPDNITCFGYTNNDPDEVCSGHGSCFDVDICVCEKEVNNVIYVGERCNITRYSCDGILANDSSSVCSGHGDCISPENCTCHNSSIYSGQYCQYWECFGKSNRYENATNSNLCSGHGNCVDYETCSCHENDADAECTYFECFGIPNNSTGVDEYGFPLLCGGHGECVDHDTCVCIDNYTSTPNCSEWSCFSLSFEDEDVCSSHGECFEHDNCSCASDSYRGEECELWGCHGILQTNLDEVCGGSGHGVCIEIDICSCTSGYSNSGDEEGGDCDVWFCGVDNKDDPSVCNERGVCSSSHSCDCQDPYEGDLCESFSCNFIPYTFPTVCSGNGDCIVVENDAICDCHWGFVGDDCETNKKYYTIMIPSLSSAGVLIMIFLAALFCALFCCFLTCIFLFIVVVVLPTVFFSSFYVLSQSLRYRKFKKLKNVNILLKEQELDEDETIGHIRIDKNLFEIKYEEIKIDRILGEGGSNSVVYKATWNKLDVAFKCFKTRAFLNNQIRLSEFEQEVSIISSISHPYVIRFYGATLRPPRVGIIMEYCENGEILDYIREKGDAVPLKERIRMTFQIANAMDYLHSRGVIHRDLKAENVLIDGNGDCKVMDFGVSRIYKNSIVAQTKQVGTGMYMAPEVASGQSNYDSKCDVFSFSILMVVILGVVNNPYPEENDLFSIEYKVAMDPGFRPNLDKLVKPFVKRKKDRWIFGVIRMCWDHDPTKRPDFKSLMEMFNRELEENEEDEEKEESEEEDSSSSDEEEEESSGESEGEGEEGKKKRTVELEDLLEEKLKQVCEKYDEDFESIMKEIKKKANREHE